MGTTMSMTAIRNRLQWNILVSALKAGRKAFIDGHMPVIHACNDKVVARTGEHFITFLKEDMDEQTHKPKLHHFKIHYTV